MKQAQVVIGANFGDEGKGLVTDFFAAQGGSDTLVVRHNGGAQAGHTVTTPEGVRHVFKHFGSGTFAGAQTFLSRFFVCNPLLFFQELPKLQALSLEPVVYVDPHARVSTPYDMMINQIVEEYRAGGRHGSCGVGFGETVERSDHPDYALYFEDLHDEDIIRTKLVKIQTEWTPTRLKALGVIKLSSEWEGRLNSPDIFDYFVEEAIRFRNTVHTAPANLLGSRVPIIFEGAQGLLLDQNGQYFPHVTRSNTGIKNAAILAIEAGIDNLAVTYVTRAYNTRHGAGPFPHELPDKPYSNIVDETNIHNDYQGSLRFGWLDIDLLSATIHNDLRHTDGKMNIFLQLAVTCLDQVSWPHHYLSDGKQCIADETTFLNRLRNRIAVDTLYTSYGPSRTTLRRAP